MSDFSFEEDNKVIGGKFTNGGMGEKKPTAMETVVMKMGVGKSAARWVLLGVAVLFFVITIVVIKVTYFKSTNSTYNGNSNLEGFDGSLPKLPI